MLLYVVTIIIVKFRFWNALLERTFETDGAESRVRLETLMNLG